MIWYMWKDRTSDGESNIH